MTHLTLIISCKILLLKKILRKIFTFKIHGSKFFPRKKIYDTELMALCGEPICINTLSSHCKGPCK